jgi:hypothetical protein
MSDAAEGLRELAAPWPGGERVKTVIERAARRANMKFSRAYEIWYGRARRIEDYERKAIAEALDRKRREAARNELQELRTSITRLEARLASIDPDFHRPSIDAARSQVRTLHGIRRASDSSLD